MSIQDEYKRLRQFLNPAIRGKNTDAILYSIGSATQYLTSAVEAVHDQIYISTATERYLDQRLADYNLIRPANVGLSDDVFREIGISVINRKQVRDLINAILLTIFGAETTNATSKSNTFEPYSLLDGDTLSMRFDGGELLTVTFTSDQFTNINSATAQEVSDAITKSLRKQGKKGSAFAKDDGQGAYVTLISDTVGPSSSVAVTGGRSQNILKFDRIRPTTAGASTQWTVAQISGGSLRFTWSGGASPSVGKVQIGDYVNVYGASFSYANRGTYTVTSVKSGIAGNAYFEVYNPNGASEVVVQGTVDSVLFFQPLKKTVISRQRYAAAFQEEARLLEVFIPATTKVVRRDRIGSAHLHEPVQTVTTFDSGKNQISDISVPVPASISDGQYLTIDAPGYAYYVYFDKTGSNLIDPAPVGRIGIRVDISLATTANDVAIAFALALTSTNQISSVEPIGSTIRACNLAVGSVSTALNVNVLGLTVTTFQVGSNPSTTTVSTPNPISTFSDQEGPYVYDISQPFVVSSVGTTSTQEYNPDTGRVISVSNASSFPDNQGLIVIGYGTSHQEGPIPYLARPSSSSLLLNPSYRIKNIHPIGTDVALVSQNGPVNISKDGTDYPFYITDVVAGRIYVEDLINMVSATGINVMITILYPGDVGLGKWDTDSSEKVYIWGD
jgi:hypothetical protein